jgi:hypothetical protein
MLVAETGQIYVPAVATDGNEFLVQLCCCWDGAEVMMDSGHCYVPLEWVREHYPELNDLWAIMEREAIRGMAQEKGKGR